MLRNTTWLIGALAAALWIAPAAAQTGSTSRDNEHAYPAGNGSDPTRSNTDNDTAPTGARTHERARAAGNTGAQTPGASIGNGSDPTRRNTDTQTAPVSGTVPSTGVNSMGTGSSASGAPASPEAAQALSKLHAGNQAEVQAGQWMQEHAQNSKVKDFAQKMVKDHTKMDRDVTAFARKHDVDLTASSAGTGETATAQQQMQELQGLSGPQADRSYMDMMVQDHQKDVSETRQAEQTARSGHDDELAKLLDKSAKKMESHLKDAQKIQHDLGSRQARNPASQ